MIRKFIAFKAVSNKMIPFAKQYIDKFSSMQSQIKQQNTKISELNNQIQLASSCEAMSLKQYLYKYIFKMVKYNSQYQPESLKQLSGMLTQYVDQLDKITKEIDRKLDGSRQQTNKIRKQLANEFLTQFVKLQQNLQKNCTIQTSPALSQGLVLIHRQLLNTLQKHGVTFFQPQIGTQFNKQLFDTLDNEGKGSKIKQVLSRGWKIQGEVIKKPIVRLQ